MSYIKSSFILDCHYRPAPLCIHTFYMIPKFVFTSLLYLYVNMCLNVYPSPTVMRSEPFVKHIQLEKSSILAISVVSLCLGVFILSKIDLNIRYIPFNTRLNTLITSKKANCLENSYFLLLLLLYLTIFEYFFIIFFAIWILQDWSWYPRN